MTGSFHADLPPVQAPVAASLIAGVPVDDVTCDETLDLIDQFITVGRAADRSFQIATVNVDFVVNALADQSVLTLLQRSDLCLPDGMPILWCGRISGCPLRERVPGADLVPRIVERAASVGWRVLLFGSAPGVAEAAAVLLADQFPGAAVQGLSGPMVSDVAEIGQDWIERMRAIRPDIICVALGNPKQERFIDAYRATLGAPVLIGVGGTLDFIVGGRRRAPVLVQRIGLEWLFRAAQEPGRLGRRYLRDGLLFGPQLLIAARIRLRTRRTDAQCERAQWTTTAEVVDLGRSDITNNTNFARLVGLSRDARRRGAEFTILGGAQRTRVELRRLGVPLSSDVVAEATAGTDTRQVES